MIWLILISVFLLVIVSTWWFGLWSNFITLINLILSGLIASSFYENLAVLMNGVMPTYVLLVEFIAIWLIFFVAFIVLRGLTDFLSPIRLKFDFWTETIGRSILSIWIACVFICFMLFTMQLAPLPPNVMDSGNDRGLGPDRFWASFVQSRSRGALSASADSTMFSQYRYKPHPDDVDLNARVFDPYGIYFLRANTRRDQISKMKILRVDSGIKKRMK